MSNKKNAVKRIGKPKGYNLREAMTIKNDVVVESFNRGVAEGYDAGWNLGVAETMDLAFIALHEAFGFGSDRILKFLDEVGKQRMILNDEYHNDTNDFEYTRDKLDRKLAEFIDKDKLQDHNGRYKINCRLIPKPLESTGSTTTIVGGK